MCVFRLGVYSKGLLERAVTYLYLSCSRGTLFPEMFDEQRAERSLNLFKAIGGQEAFVTPRDGKASIHMMTLKAQDLERKLEVFGAQWQRCELSDSEGNQVLAIIPPAEPSAEWEAFERTLGQFGWSRKRVIHEEVEQEGIITCMDADCIPEGEETRCFLYCHSTSQSFIRDRKRAGYYLGMKQDACFFDNRGIWKSQGVPSEGGYYLDVEAVHEALQREGQYDPQRLWLVGFCGGGSVMAHMKRLMHQQGVNFVAEQSFCHLRRDFIAQMPTFAQWVADRTMSSLYYRDASSSEGIQETAFNVEALWRDLERYEGPGGRVVLIHAANDQRLPQESKDLYAALAQTVNASVSRVYFTSLQEENPHADDFFPYPEAARAFTRIVFSA